MKNSLLIGNQVYNEIMAHLLQNRLEQVAFILAETSTDSAGIQFTTTSHYLVPPHELAFQSPYHVELADETQSRLIKDAWDRGTSLVEIHSHPNTKAGIEFSTSDLLGFQEFVPHVWWRLKGRPYAALVVGHSGFDALVWQTGANTPEQLAYLQHGDQQRRPSSLTIRKLRR